MPYSFLIYKMYYNDKLLIIIKLEENKLKLLIYKI